MVHFRKLTRLVLFVVVLAFAALIFFEWGMNATASIKRRDLDKGIIGRVNNIPIFYNEYRRLLQMAYERREQNRGKSEDEIKAGVWRALVEDKLWWDILNKEKITVTDEEVLAIIRNQPPRELLDHPEMKDDSGRFDIRKYQMLLRSPQNLPWLQQYESDIRTALPREKLKFEFMTSGWISPDEENLYLNLLTKTVAGIFLYLPYDQIFNQIPVDQEQLLTFFNEKVKDYVIPARRNFKYVYFPKEATSEDTMNAQSQIDEIYLLLKEGRHFQEIAQDYADNTDIEIKQEIPVELIGVFNKLKKDEVSPPIKTARGYSIIKRIDRDRLQKIDINIEISPSTIVAIKEKIDAFIQTARASGFDSSAKIFNLLVRETRPLTMEQLILPGLENPSQLKNYANRARISEISPPIAGISGYFVFSLDTIIPPTRPNFEDVREQVRIDYLRSKEKTIAQQYVRTWLDKNLTLEEIAQRDKRFVMERIKSSNYEELRANYPSELIGAIYSLSPTETKTVFTEWGVYLIRCDSVRQIPLDSSKISLIYQEQDARIKNIYQQIFQEPEIIDHRDAFFD